MQGQHGHYVLAVVVDECLGLAVFESEIPGSV